jgi:hypothetical protein
MAAKRPAAAGQLASIARPVEDAETSPRARVVTLAELTPDPKNARRRTERSHGMLSRSISDFGAARSIVVDENGVVLCGNGTVEAAAIHGINRVLVIPTDGNTLVAVQRTDLSPTAKTGLALADNRSSDTSEFSGQMLAELMEADTMLDISPWFTEDEFSALLKADEVEPPLPPEEPAAKSGLEITIAFDDQEAFDRFGSLLVQLAASLPELDELSERLALVIEEHLNRRDRRG